MTPPEHDDQDRRELEAARDPVPRPDDPAAIALTRRVGAAARALTDDDRAPADPPPGVWAAIAARTGQPSGAAERPPGLEDATAAPRGRAAGAERRAPVADLGPAGRGRRPRRGRRAWWAAAAAAVMVVAAAAGVAAARGGGGGGQTLATAELAPLPDAAPGTGTSGAAVVVRGGSKVLDLHVDAPPSPEGFYEVWLIDRDIEGMVSLGPVRADGAYQIPADVDVTRYPIVDVSIEPPDGVPTHSGRSVLRGMLS